MKKSLLAILIMSIAFGVNAQNLQLHYDFRGNIEGKDASANILTGTFEFLKNDQRGSTFMFVDFDFHFNGDNIGLMYMELSRTQKFGKLPVMGHIEYNGGIMKGLFIPHAYLAGAAYDKVVGPFYLKTYLAYKLNQFNKVSHDMQWTVVWDGTLLNDRLSINGFFDIWSQNMDRNHGVGGKDCVLLAEPQFWYNVIPKTFSVGTEIELSNNFYGPGFKCYPTAAVKYIF
ncbi:DUF5020 family protein [Porphyromonadaceae bacterium]